ncbi:MAG: CBS domain-containing protein [Nitrospirales bacterium]
MMTTRVVAVTRNYRARDLAVLLQSGDFGGVPVIESGSKLVGIVSEFDLMTALLNQKDLSVVTAEHIMTTHPVTVEETSTAEVAMKAMIDNQIVRLPVVHNGKLIGVIARSDILNYMIEPNLLNVYGA